MDYKKIILIVLILLLITGCSRFRKGDGPTTTISSQEVHTGSDGIKIEMINGAPPDEVYENIDFYVSVLLKNQGAFDVEDGNLLLGIEENYMSIEGGKGLEKYSLKGKSIQNPPGEQKIIDFKVKSKEIEKQSEQHKTSLFLTTCYGYRTEAVETVCIDPDFYSITPVKKACEVKDISLNNQGAPVAVTKIEQRILQDADKNIIKPEFLIYIKNAGEGDVIDKDKVNDVCSSSGIDYKTWNTVYADVFLYDKQLNCKPKKEDEKGKTGYIRLKEGEDFIKCVYEEGIGKENPAYTTPLKIDLNYGYTETTSKEIVIKRETVY